MSITAKNRLDFGQEVLDRLFESRQRLQDWATSAARRPINCFMISGVNALPRSARACEATRKKRCLGVEHQTIQIKHDGADQDRVPPRSVALRKQLFLLEVSFLIERNGAKIGFKRELGMCVDLVLERTA